MDASEIHRRGAAAWPGIELPLDELTAYIAARTGDEDRAGDLYIACACARGDERAIARFDSTFFPEVRAAIARLSNAGPIVDEAMQLLRERMFVAKDKPPGIAGYAGRGDLRGWLRVAGVRAALGLLRARRGDSDGAALDGIAAADPSPLLGLMQREYATHARDAVRDAFAMLEVRDRNLLRQSFVDGLTIDDLGALYGVHRATVARWLEKARTTLEKRTRALLRERLGIGQETLDSIIKIVHSQLDVSLSGL